MAAGQEHVWRSTTVLWWQIYYRSGQFGGNRKKARRETDCASARLISGAPKDKLTFPKVSCSPPWGWRGGRWRPRPECATGCPPGWRRWSPSSPCPLRDLWKGSAGVFLRAWVPRWDVLVPFCSSTPFVHLCYPSLPSLLVPCCSVPSKWRCTRFAAGPIKVSRFEQDESQLVCTSQVFLLVHSILAVWSLI